MTTVTTLGLAALLTLLSAVVHGASITHFACNNTWNPTVNSNAKILLKDLCQLQLRLGDLVSESVNNSSAPRAHMSEHALLQFIVTSGIETLRSSSVHGVDYWIVGSKDVTIFKNGETDIPILDVTITTPNMCGQTYLSARVISSSTDTEALAIPIQLICPESMVDLGLIGVVQEDYDVYNHRPVLRPTGQPVTFFIRDFKLLVRNFLTNSSYSARTGPSTYTVSVYMKRQLWYMYEWPVGNNSQQTVLSVDPALLEYQVGDVMVNEGNRLVPTDGGRHTSALPGGSQTELLMENLALKSKEVCGNCFMVAQLKVPGQPSDVNRANNYYILPVFVDCWGNNPVETIETCQVIPNYYDGGQTAWITYSVPAQTKTYEYKSEERSIRALNSDVDGATMQEIALMKLTTDIQSDRLNELGQCVDTMWGSTDAFVTSVDVLLTSIQKHWDEVETKSVVQKVEHSKISLLLSSASDMLTLALQPNNPLHNWLHVPFQWYFNPLMQYDSNAESKHPVDSNQISRRKRNVDISGNYLDDEVDEESVFKTAAQQKSPLQSSSLSSAANNASTPFASTVASGSTFSLGLTTGHPTLTVTLNSKTTNGSLAGSGSMADSLSKGPLLADGSNGQVKTSSAPLASTVASSVSSSSQGASSTTRASGSSSASYVSNPTFQTKVSVNGTGFTSSTARIAGSSPGLSASTIRSVGSVAATANSVGSMGTTARSAGSMGTTARSAGSMGTTARSAGSMGTTVGSAGSMGTTARSAGSIGTTARSAGSMGTTVGSAGSMGTTVGSVGSVGTTVGSARSMGTTARNAGSIGTSARSAGSMGATSGGAGSMGTTARSAGSIGTTVGSAGSMGTTVGSAGSMGTTTPSAGSIGMTARSSGTGAGSSVGPAAPTAHSIASMSSTSRVAGSSTGPLASTGRTPGSVVTNGASGVTSKAAMPTASNNTSGTATTKASGATTNAGSASSGRTLASGQSSVGQASTTTIKPQATTTAGVLTEDEKNFGPKPRWHEQVMEALYEMVKYNGKGLYYLAPQRWQALSAFMNTLLYGHKEDFQRYSYIPKSTMDGLVSLMKMAIGQNLPRLFDDIPLPILKAVSDWITAKYQRHIEVGNSACDFQEGLELASNITQELMLQKQWQDRSDQLALLDHVFRILLKEDHTQYLAELYSRITAAQKMSRTWMIRDGIPIHEPDAKDICERYTAVKLWQLKTFPVFQFAGRTVSPDQYQSVFWSQERGTIFRGDRSELTGQVFWTKVATCSCPAGSTCGGNVVTSQNGVNANTGNSLATGGPMVAAPLHAQVDEGIDLTNDDEDTDRKDSFVGFGFEEAEDMMFGE